MLQRGLLVAFHRVDILTNHNMANNHDNSESVLFPFQESPYELFEQCAHIIIALVQIRELDGETTEERDRMFTTKDRKSFMSFINDAITCLKMTTEKCIDWRFGVRDNTKDDNDSIIEKETMELSHLVRLCVRGTAVINRCQIFCDHVMSKMIVLASREKKSHANLDKEGKKQGKDEKGKLVALLLLVLFVSLIRLIFLCIFFFSVPVLFCSFPFCFLLSRQTWKTKRIKKCQKCLGQKYGTP
jgi:hypothetical protein